MQARLWCPLVLSYKFYLGFIGFHYKKQVPWLLFLYLRRFSEWKRNCQEKMHGSC